MTSCTVPARGATPGVCLFIHSRMISSWSSVTKSPGLTSTFHTVPTSSALTSVTSTALELRLALLEERAPPLRGVLRQGHKGHLAVQVFESRLEVHVLLPVERVTTQMHDRGRLLSQPSGELLRCVFEPVERHHAVHQAVLVQLRGRPPITEPNHLEHELWRAHPFLWVG